MSEFGCVVMSFRVVSHTDPSYWDFEAVLPHMQRRLQLKLKGNNVMAQRNSCDSVIDAYFNTDANYFAVVGEEALSGSCFTAC